MLKSEVTGSSLYPLFCCGPKSSSAAEAVQRLSQAETGSLVSGAKGTGCLTIDK